MTAQTVRAPHPPARCRSICLATCSIKATCGKLERMLPNGKLSVRKMSHSSDTSFRKKPDWWDTSGRCLRPASPTRQSRTWSKFSARG
jgi:hypothetical protein